jgi:hypothetical protein
MRHPMLVFSVAAATALTIGSVFGFVHISQPARSYQPVYASWYCTNEPDAEKSVMLEIAGNLTSDDVWKERMGIPTCKVEGRVVREEAFTRYMSIGTRRIAIYRILVDDDANAKPITAYAGLLAGI